jgi:C4-dicarboxylate-specific signal transduction histidine kinase
MGTGNLVDFFSEKGFMPHGHCYLWNPSLVWTNVITDMLIGLAYVGISLSLYGLIRKIRLPFSAMVLSFGVFIGACGATHFMEVWNLWYPDYWISAFTKVVTAIASVATGIWLVRLSPAIVAFAETAKKAENHRVALIDTNRELEARTTELVRTNELLASQQKALTHSAKMSALGEMAGGIAHEINSPLGIILLHANRLERLQARGGLTPEILLEEAKLIATTASRIGDIIKGLRAFAREGEKDPFETASIEQLVQNVLVLCQNKFSAHSVALEVSPIPAGLTAECREVQVGQVLLNLLNNAYDAVVAGPAKWVRLTVEDTGDAIRLAVSDGGAGIDPAIRDKLMQPFFSTKEVGKGTGLGLSISKGIMDAHGGSLELDADRGNTRFVATFPKTHTASAT